MNTIHRYIVLVAALLAACANPLDADWRRQVGDIAVGATPGGNALPSLLVPDTVQAGVPFAARVTTFGSSSCNRADGATVRTQGSLAEITPYDRRATGNVSCTADLAPFPRDVELRFQAPGTATVRLVGRQVAGAPEQVVERTVVVR